jgi:hypothetical protein
MKNYLEFVKESRELGIEADIKFLVNIFNISIKRYIRELFQSFKVEVVEFLDEGDKEVKAKFYQRSIKMRIRGKEEDIKSLYYYIFTKEKKFSKIELIMY